MAEETFKTNGNAPLPVKETISEEIHEEPTPDIEIPLEIDTHNFETLSQDTAELTEEEKLQRRQLLRKLFRYKQLFPNEVQGLPISDGADLSLHQLQILVSDVEFMVATRKSLHASRTMFLSTINIGEVIAKPVGLQLTGLTNVCANNEDLLSVVDELAVKYENNLMISPEKRLALIMGQICLQLHQYNKQKSNSGGVEEVNKTQEQEIKDTKREELMKGL